MNKDFWDMLAGAAAPGDLDKLSPPLKRRLETLSEELGHFLNRSSSATRSEIFSKLCEEVIAHLEDLENSAHLAPTNTRPEVASTITVVTESNNGQVTKDILDWARRQLNEEETVAGLREIRETGGIELSDFLDELEREATSNE